MKVEVKMVINTPDFGEKEFKKEIEKLIADIDSASSLVSFEMKEITPPSAIFSKNTLQTEMKECKNFLKHTIKINGKIQSIRKELKNGTGFFIQIKRCKTCDMKFEMDELFIKHPSQQIMIACPGCHTQN